MFTRPVSIAVLAFALCLTPAGAEGQVSASVSFQLGLFDGIGIGLAAPHCITDPYSAPVFMSGSGLPWGSDSVLGLGWVRTVGTGTIRIMTRITGTAMDTGMITAGLPIDPITATAPSTVVGGGIRILAGTGGTPTGTRDSGSPSDSDGTTTADPPTSILGGVTRATWPAGGRSGRITPVGGTTTIRGT